MEGSSKVTVEYHDPDGLLPLLSEQLQSRLPLRNLNWKSSSRPLRSIDALHVDLIPELVQQNANLAVPANPAASVSSPSDLQKTPAGLPSPNDALKTPTRQRRHQIPGLHQTPYLRIYLFRCDDKDVYRAAKRQRVKDWIKAHTPLSQGSSSASKQENHDAFEWMILHVVVPDTVAASEPRVSSSTSKESNNASEKASSSSRWGGKSSGTILEKLKSDFNESSKHAPDRIAQVRLPKSAVPSGTVPSPAPPVGSHGFSPQEQDYAWDDLISKMKNLILLSFDRRVAQYEDDIREREAQRSLPGWNFCTFFLLKEGLARGFESVGLVDDALVGYDELSVGLDSIIREQASDELNNQAGTFPQITEDLHKLLKGELIGKAPEVESGAYANAFEQPLNTSKKDYRELILSNNISVFDFKCYIFSRQLALLLRLSNVRRHGSKPAMDRRSYSEPPMSARISNQGAPATPRPDESEDLPSLIALCLRALSFIPAAGRIMREDIMQAESVTTSQLDALVDNVVSSWMFSAAQQILTESATSSLPVSIFQEGLDNASASKLLSHSGKQHEQKARIPEPKTNLHPARTSSLQGRRPPSIEPPWINPPSSSTLVYDSSPADSGPRSAKEKTPPTNNYLQQLAAQRAELYMMQRRLLERLGTARGWSMGWSTLKTSDALQTISLSDVSDNIPEEAKSPREPQPGTTSDEKGLLQPVLATAAGSLDAFRDLFLSLSERASKHFAFAKLVKAAEQIMGDLAVINFETGDYATAAAYFQRIAPLYSEDRWVLIEVTILKMYAQCLKVLHRKDEYSRILLTLLAKAATKQTSRSSPHVDHSVQVPKMSSNWLDEDEIEIEGQLRELLDFSAELPYNLTVQMTKYFDAVVIEPFIHHFKDRDGFQMKAKFRHLFDDELEARSIKLRLVNTTGGQMREIWLEAESPVTIQKGPTAIWLRTNISIVGYFNLERLVIEAKKVVFVHEFSSKPPPSPSVNLTASTTQQTIPSNTAPRLLCYPRNGALNAVMSLCRTIHIDKPKSIDVTISTGDNEILSTDLRLRAGSAGLRLHVNKAEVVDDANVTLETPTTGSIKFGALSSYTSCVVRIPYDVENALRELLIRPEVTYKTPHGEYIFLDNASINAELPLDVNVFDVFKKNALFSKFTVRTAGKTPLRLLDIELKESDAFSVASPTRITSPLLVFSHGPACMTYKITRRRAGSNTSVKPEQPLMLAVQYRCIDEDVHSAIEDKFFADLSTSAISTFISILLPTLRSKLNSHTLTTNYERAAMLNRISIPSFEEIEWEDIIATIPRSQREEVRDWLHAWHTRTKIELPSSSDPTYTDNHPSRRIIIAVEVPTMQILHTARLSLQHPISSQTPPPTPSHNPHPIIAPLGQALRATLSIHHTRHWSRLPPSSPSKTTPSDDEPMQFIYELHTNPDIFLISGPRRQTFTSPPNETLTFDVLLIPLQPGRHLLPRVDIRPVGSGPGRGRDGRAGDADEGLVSCETDYRSQAETVVVVKGVQGVTVDLRSAGQVGGGGVVVGVERRGGGCGIVECDIPPGTSEREI
ncbi:MAG: hypothetical protein M1820_005931 [Bogoriella megaspora]|nr:MAG: hypothetical protein M1820_005931 [Bogoriella megaspora]